MNLFDIKQRPLADKSQIRHIRKRFTTSEPACECLLRHLQPISARRFFLTAGPERNSGGTGSLHPLPPPAVEPLAYPRRSRLQRQKNVGAPPGVPTPTNNYRTLCNVPLFHSLSCPFAATYHVTMSAPHGAAITVEASNTEPSAAMYLNCPPEGTLIPNLSCTYSSSDA